MCAAMLCEQLGDEQVQCQLRQRRCPIAPGKTGHCKARLKRAFFILFILSFILALLLSSVLRTELRSTWAAGSHLRTTPTASTVEPHDIPNHADVTEEQPSLRHLSAPAVTQSPDDKWLVETVDSERYVGQYTSLALDGSGRPHISYYDETNRDLKYAWRDGAGWQIETVDSVGDVGEYTSLVLDRTSRPHVSYYDAINADLKHAWHDGADWQIETVDSEGRVGEFTSLALDGSDQPHISYLDCDPNYDLKYAWHDGTGWQIETVDSAGSVGAWTSLALDGLGWPHISYYDDTHHSLKYAWHNGAGWQIGTVDGAGDVGKWSSLALDGAGQPHISYYDDTHRDLKYARHDGTGWRIETVDSTGDVGMWTSLALDRAGQPHISYHGGGDLKHAYHDGTGWQIETVDSAGNTGWFTSLALDRADQPHIGYYDSTSDGLKHAWLMGPLLLLDKRATPGDRLRSSDTLTYDLTFSGPDLSARLRDPLPDAVRYISGSITSTVTPPAIYSPTIRAVVWQGTLPTDTTQLVRFQVAPAITIARSLSLPLPIINTAWLTGTESGRIVSATATVNLLPPPLSLNKQAMPGDRLRHNKILTYTLALSGPGLSVRLWDPLPDAVHYISGSITSTVTPPAVYSPTVGAVIWKGTLPTDTAQLVRFQVAPAITIAKSLSLPLPIVNTAWLTGTESGRIVSATATVNLLPPPLSLNKQATPRDGLRNNEALTYTLALSGPGLSVRLRDSLPDAVRYISGSITSTLTPPAVYSPTVKAVVWQGALPTDTAQVVRFQVTPGITGTGSLLLALPIVNTAWLTSTESGRIVFATAIVNGWHVYLPLVMRQSL